MNIDTWIVAYYSPNLEQPVFLIWYTDTDENNTDKLLTFKTGDIFASASLSDIKDDIVRYLGSINAFEKLKLWLEEFDILAPVEVTEYRIDHVYQAVRDKNFDIPTLENLVNFRNLVDDYVNQDETNKDLQAFADDESIMEAWNYYYKFIFWPRFNDVEKFKTWDRPPFIADSKKLMKGLEQLIKNFERNIVLAKST